MGKPERGVGGFPQETMPLLTHAEAAQMLGRHPHQVDAYVREGKLRVFRRIRAARMYLREEVEALYGVVHPGGLSLAQIAQRYGVTYETAHYNFCVKRTVLHEGHRGRIRVYREGAVRLVAAEEGWRQAGA